MAKKRASKKLATTSEKMAVIGAADPKFQHFDRTLLDAAPAEREGGASGTFSGTTDDAPDYA